MRFICVICLLLSNIAIANVHIGGRTFTYEQLSNYAHAYKYGERYGLGYELMGVLFAESNGKQVHVGDRVNNKFKRSYGIMQVKLGTYYWVKNKGYKTYKLQDKSMVEEEILAKLMTDNIFNIHIASDYLKMMIDICGSKSKGISGYNRGHCKDDNLALRYRSRVNNFIAFAKNNNLNNTVTTNL